MKCRICGAKLRKEGDICKNCYEEYCKEEELENDVNEIFKIKREYLKAYQLTQYTDWYFVSIFVIIAFLSQAQYTFALLYLPIAILVLVMAIYVEKRKARNTVCTFYDKKIVFEYGGIKKTLAYSDLKEVTRYQNFFQKKFNLADIQFHPKSGTYLIGGFEVKNVSVVDNTWNKIEEIILSKKEK